MPDPRQQSDSAWEQFFASLLPCEDALPRVEVQDELRRYGIDVREAVTRVQAAYAKARGKAELEAARVRRLLAPTSFEPVAAPASGSLRGNLNGLIAGLSEGAVQATYFRKLESAATDEDLRSLFEDIQRLEASSEGIEDGSTSPE